MEGWKTIAEATLGELGLVWSPRWPDRIDLLGRVIEYSDGTRTVSSSATGVEFTHWHPLPSPPKESME